MAQLSVLDPFAAVLDLGRERDRARVLAAVVAATLLHGYTMGRGALALLEVQAFADHVRSRVAQPRTYDVDIAHETPPPAPEPPPPLPEPRAAQPVARMPSVAPATPPPPAAAGRVLTAAPDPDEPVDLTGNGFVVGNADSYAGGTTTATGTSPTAVRGVAAPSATTPSAKPVGPASNAPSHVRAAAPESRSWNDCGFPSEADADQIDFARVTLVVSVSPEGAPRSVSVVNDPGHGFGRLARQCALRKRYEPALGAAGDPVAGTTPPFTVTFTR